jgi:hypothetical protein
MMRQFFIEHFYLELEKRSKLLKVALEQFAGHKWPPQSDDRELLALYKNCLARLGTSFNPHRANSPLILRFDLSDIDLGYYDDYHLQHYEKIGLEQNSPFNVLVKRKYGDMLCVTDHRTGLMWAEACVCHSIFEVRQYLKGWRLPTVGEIQEYIKVRGHFLVEDDSSKDYWVHDKIYQGENLLGQALKEQQYIPNMGAAYVLKVRECR